MKHAMTPWRITTMGRMFDRTECTVRVEGVAIPGGEDAEAVANAEFIVKAVNAHDKLVAALQRVIEESGNDCINEMERIARAALAEANQDPARQSAQDAVNESRNNANQCAQDALYKGA